LGKTFVVRDLTPSIGALLVRARGSTLENDHHR